MSLLGTAASGATGFLSQYAVYILGTLAVILIAFAGTQTVRLKMCQKDLAASQAQIAEKAVVIAVNKAVMEKLTADAAGLQKRIEDSGVEIQKIERKHAEDIKKLLTENVLAEDASCDDVAKWAKDIARRKK